MQSGEVLSYPDRSYWRKVAVRAFDDARRMLGLEKGRLSPLIPLFPFVFLQRFAATPRLLHREAEAELESLRAAQEDRAARRRIADETAKLREEGALLYYRRVLSDADAAAWVVAYQGWGERVYYFLGERVSAAQQISFLNIGGVVMAELSESFNPVHNEQRLALAERLRRLQLLIDRYG